MEAEVQRRSVFFLIGYLASHFTIADDDNPSSDILVLHG